jgi:hypothetical protein
MKDERGRTVPPDDFARAWSYVGSTVFERRLLLDTDAILREVGCPEGEIGIMCTWRSTGSGIRENLAAGRLKPYDGTTDVILSGSIPHVMLSGAVEFRTRLCLTDQGGTSLPLSPPRGAVFWEIRESIPIGDGTLRFPIVEVAFGDRSDLPRGARWRLEVNAETLDAHALHAITLFVNSDAPLFQHLRDDTDDPGIGAIHRRYLEGDIRRQLVLVATAHADALDEGSFEAESLGELLRHVLELHFPGMTAQSVRELLEDPSEFDVRLQAGMRRFWSESA